MQFLGFDTKFIIFYPFSRPTLCTHGSLARCLLWRSTCNHSLDLSIAGMYIQSRQHQPRTRRCPGRALPTPTQKTTCSAEESSFSIETHTRVSIILSYKCLLEGSRIDLLAQRLGRFVVFSPKSIIVNTKSIISSIKLHHFQHKKPSFSAYFDAMHELACRHETGGEVKVRDLAPIHHCLA